jgi:AraC-like DNA-binding protein
MPRVGTALFTDPEDYKNSFRGARVTIVFAGQGDFRASLTWVELANLHLLRSQENLPRIAYVSLTPKRVFFSFPTHFDPPPISVGIELQQGDIVFHGRGEGMHQRTDGASHWAFISLPPEHLARFGKVLTGVDLVLPTAAQVLRPPTTASAHLRRLHLKACRIAKTKPDIIAHREVARALEHELLHALVNCLNSDAAPDYPPTKQRHASIMVRFEEALATHGGRQLRMPALCAAIGVPERTLRTCCMETLGMSPCHYIRLRRLNMVRSALWRADSAASVQDLARQYGFSELGRFAADYRAAFGEAPSDTLRGRSCAIREAQFIAT